MVIHKILVQQEFKTNTNSSGRAVNEIANNSNNLTIHEAMKPDSPVTYTTFPTPIFLGSIPFPDVIQKQYRNVIQFGHKAYVRVFMVLEVFTKASL